MTTNPRASDSTADQVQDLANQARDLAADRISGIAKTLRDLSAGLSDGSVAERTLGQIATGIADASESLQGKDLGQLASAASDAARRNPTVFIGGAVLLGFAAARFLRSAEAAEPDDGPEPHGGEHGGEHGGDQPVDQGGDLA